MFYKLSPDDQAAARNIAVQIEDAMHAAQIGLSKLGNTPDNTGLSPSLALASQMLWAKRERQRKRGEVIHPAPFEAETHG